MTPAPAQIDAKWQLLSSDHIPTSQMAGLSISRLGQQRTLDLLATWMAGDRPRRVATTSAHRLHVSREHFLSGMAKALGAQDVQVGDAAYDERFQIKSDDEAWARRVLAAPIRKQHLEDAKLQLRVHKGWVETFAEGFDLDADTLVRRMRLTAALAFSVGE